MSIHGAAHNHSAKTLVVGKSQSRKWLNHHIYDNLAQRAHTPDVCFSYEASCDPLFHVRPGFNFYQILHFVKQEREGGGIPSHVTTPWGRDAGKNQQNSDIVLLSIYSLSNYYKNIQNIKNCL